MVEFNSEKHYHGKPCVKCGSDVRYIHQGRCVKCRRKAGNQWKQENKEHLQQYYEENKERISEYHKEWYQENKENIQEQRKEYYRNTKDERSNYHRKWYLKNRKHKLQQNKEWRDNNLEKQKVYVHKRRKLIEQNGGDYTEEDWIDLCEYYNYTCLRCGNNSVPMTVDHIIPLSKGGSNNIWNIAPLCFSCNSSKNNKIIDYRPKEDIPIEFKKELEKILGE